jgi:hypothetical protein
MDKTLLVERDILAGQRLLEVLDASDIPILGAFWYEVPESERWRLFLVSPLVEKLGPIALYRRLITMLDDSPALKDLGIDLHDIGVVGPRDSMVKLLASYFSDGVGPTTLNDSTRGMPGVPVDSAYVYRLDVPAPGRKR